MPALVTPPFVQIRALSATRNAIAPDFLDSPRRPLTSNEQISWSRPPVSPHVPRLVHHELELDDVEGVDDHPWVWVWASGVRASFAGGCNLSAKSNAIRHPALRAHCGRGSLCAVVLNCECQARPDHIRHRFCRYCTSAAKQEAPSCGRSREQIPETCLPKPPEIGLQKRSAKTFAPWPGGMSGAGGYFRLRPAIGNQDDKLLARPRCWRRSFMLRTRAGFWPTAAPTSTPTPIEARTTSGRQTPNLLSPMVCERPPAPGLLGKPGRDNALQKC